MRCVMTIHIARWIRTAVFVILSLDSAFVSRVIARLGENAFTTQLALFDYSRK